MTTQEGLPQQQGLPQQPGNRSAGERASAAAETAKQEVTNVTAEMRSEARRLGSEFQRQVSSRASEEQHRLAGAVRSFGDELQNMARADQPGETPGRAHRVAEQLGKQTASLGSWLESHEPGDILDEVSSMARRRPGTFLLGAAALGVLAGRTMRGMAQRTGNGHAAPSTEEQRIRDEYDREPAYGSEPREAAEHAYGRQRVYGTDRPYGSERGVGAPPPGQPQAAPVEEVGSSESPSYVRTTTGPMDPVPGLEEGTRSREVSDPATRFPERQHPPRQEQGRAVDPEEEADRG